jgi:cell division septation protein DedD
MIEGGTLTLSFLFASFLIFVFGMYVGKEVQSQKTVHTAQPLRVPVVSSKTGLLARESAATSPIHPTLASLPLTAFTRTAAPVARPAPREKIRPKPPKRATTSDRTPLPPSRPLPKKVAKKSRVEAPSVSPKPVPIRVAAPSVPTRSVSSPPSPALKVVKKSAPKSKGWSVQVQATTRQAAAEQTAKRLRRKGYTPSISKIIRQGKVLYRVRVGPFGRESDAKAAVSRFRRGTTFAQAYPVSN